MIQLEKVESPIETTSFASRRRQIPTHDVDDEDEELGGQIIIHEGPDFKCCAWVRHILFEIFERPTRTYFALFINCFSFFLTVVSIITFTIISIPEYYDSRLLFSIEWICMLIFAAEYILRGWSSSSIRKFVGDGYNFIDVMSFAPFFIFHYAGYHNSEASFLTIFRILRLNRAIEVFRFSQLTKGAKVFMNSIRQSLASIFLWIIILCFCLFVFSGLIFWAERGDWVEELREYQLNGEKSQLQSIPEAMWWTIQTMTTVGYGDIIPQSGWGKLIAGISMVVGIMTISLPVTIIGINFTHVIQLYKEHTVFDPSLAGEEFEYWIRHASKKELLKGIEKRNKEVQRIITRLGEI